MNNRGFVKGGSIDKQRHGIMQHFVQGKVRAVELSILEAVPLSSSFDKVGHMEAVQNSSGEHSYTAHFKMTSGEVLSKKVETIKEGNDWLLSSVHSYKKGTLTQNLKKAYSEVKGGVALEKAGDALAETALSPMLGKPADADLQGESVQDVTAAFLDVKVQKIEKMDDSKICIHKGSLLTAKNLWYKDRNLFGLMLGKPAWNKKQHVTNMILVGRNEMSFESLVCNDRVVGQCKAHGLEIYGAIFTAPSEVPEHESNQMRCSLLNQFSCETPLLIEMDFSYKVEGIFKAFEKVDSDTCKRTSIQWTSQPHDVSKRLLYNICFLEDLGTSHLEAATQKVCQAILKTLVERPARPKPVVDMAHFQYTSACPNGFCGWHAILAFEDLDAYFKIPRHDTGYPINVAILKDEESKARELRQSVCLKALDECDSSYLPAIHRVLENPSFSPADLEWISYVCSITIRCTCSKEAC